MQAVVWFLYQVRASLHRSSSLLGSVGALKHPLGMVHVRKSPSTHGIILSMRVDWTQFMRHLYALIVRSIHRNDLIRIGEGCLHLHLGLRSSGTGLEEIAKLSCSGCGIRGTTRDHVSITLLIFGDPATQ